MTQRKRDEGEFRSEESSTIQRIAEGVENDIAEKYEEFENVLGHENDIQYLKQSDEQYDESQDDQETRNRLNAITNEYHRRHSISRDPLKDQRVLPINRYKAFMTIALQKGYNPDRARNFALQKLEEQMNKGEIAGEWAGIEDKL
jgi:hypothetical protein